MTENDHIEEMANAMCGVGEPNCRECEQNWEFVEIAKCDLVIRAKTLYSKGYRKIPDNIGEFSDGYHTFNELYHHRAVLFSVICNMFPERSWKSKLHDTGDMFGGMFIVGIETEHGQATYHYDIEPYWNMFKVKELEKAPKWDGHTSTDAIQRIGNISTKGYRKLERGEWNLIGNGNGRAIHWKCSICGYETLDAVNGDTDFCPNCGADMRGGENDTK